MGGWGDGGDPTNAGWNAGDPCHVGKGGQTATWCTLTDHTQAKGKGSPGPCSFTADDLHRRVYTLPK